MKLEKGMLCFLINCVNKDNNDKIVQLTAYMGVMGGRNPQGVTYEETWAFDPPVIGFDGTTTTFSPTRFLKPLDNPGDDEVDTFYLDKPIVKEKEHV